MQPEEGDDTALHAHDAPQAPPAGTPPPASPMEEDDSDGDPLRRQLSWALPELPSAGSTAFTWGRSDMGQTGQGLENNTALPRPVRTLQERAVVHAAGSAYNSAFVTSARPPRCPAVCLTRARHSRAWNCGACSTVCMPCAPARC